MSDILVDLLMNVVNAVLGETAMAPDDLRINDTTMDFVEGIWDYFALVGIGLTLVYFLMEMNRKFAFERTDFTLKSFAAPFLKLAIAVFALMNGARLIGYIVKLGNVMITFADGANITGTLTTDLGTTIKDTFGDAGFIAALIMIIPCLLMFLVSVVCSLVWKYKALTYKIEFLFRVGISPIALADIYSGQNAQAIRWLKSMIGMGLYGMSMILVIKLGHAVGLAQIINVFDTTSLSVDDVWSSISYLFILIIVPVAELGVIGAVRSAIKEAIG